MTDKVTDLKLVRDRRAEPDKTPCHIVVTGCANCGDTWMKVYHCAEHGDFYLCCANCEEPQMAFDVRLRDDQGPEGAA